MHLSVCGIVRSVGLCRDLQKINAHCGLGMKLPFAMALSWNTRGRGHATFKAHPSSTAAPGLVVEPAEGWPSFSPTSAPRWSG